MQTELKIPAAALAIAVAISCVSVVLTRSHYSNLEHKWRQVKRSNKSESARLVTALTDRQAFAKYQPAYASLLDNHSLLVHNRIALLSYLAWLGNEVDPLAHSYSIGAAAPIDEPPSNLPRGMVADIAINAEFLHGDHLAEYLWQLEQQRIALLRVVAVDVALGADNQAAGDGKAPPLVARIKLHWYALPTTSASG